ncbi:uncharacterized protein LOC125808793 [Solanum verrucosum]|uniref:uncharacterized protein LOC125808793 n=1 Tax=Solanum verrucosum TaxID=315347 RepID=UPI0020CFFC62|nr:uncharacterized protein LOC125808793 [Solanum verrucosum]
MEGNKRNKRPFEEPSDKNHINLKIKSQDGTFMYYKVKPTSIMKRIFMSYSERKQILNYKTVRFLYNGNRVSPRSTVNQDDTILHFKVNPSTIMKDIFMSYSSKKQMMNYKVFRFFFDGKRLSPKKTVNELGLKNGDEIDAMIHQDGGGSACNY